jgi:hypothetical protein
MIESPVFHKSAMGERWMTALGHKPAYLSPRRPGGMSAVPAIVSDCCIAAKEVRCHERTKTPSTRSASLTYFLFMSHNMLAGHLLLLDDAFRYFPMRDFTFEQD